MATLQIDGSIRLKSGKTIYADTPLEAGDLVEILPLLQRPAWPFVSGGGGAGAVGPQGPAGPSTGTGSQGFQGSVGPQGSSNSGESVVLQLGNTSSVPGGGELQLLGPGQTQVGFAVYVVGTISGASIAVNVPDNTRDYELEIRVNGSTAATIPLPSGDTVAFSNSLSAPVVPGDIVTVFLVRTSGGGASTFSDEQALVSIKS